VTSGIWLLYDHDVDMIKTCARMLLRGRFVHQLANALAETLDITSSGSTKISYFTKELFANARWILANQTDMLQA
jgi:hypothetical protein